MNTASRTTYVEGFGTARKNPDGSYTVSFTPEEEGRIRRYASQRSFGSRRGGLYDQRRSQRRSSTDIDIIGFAGEVAVALLTGTTVRVSGAPDVGADHIFAGLRIDTKTSEGDTLYFAKPPKCDAAVFVQMPDFDNSYDVIVWGWHPKPTTGNLPDLRPTDELLALGEEVAS
jgi:hypothetical protein